MNLKDKFRNIKKTSISYLKGIRKNPKKKWTFISVFVIALIAIFVYANLGLFVAGIVNGQPISRLRLVKELEKQGGNQVLDSLVTEKLIDQEAKKNGITVTQSDIDNEISAIEDQLKAQGTDLDTALAFQGQTREDLGQTLRVKIIVEKILGNKISVTEDEIKSYFEENKTSFPANSTLESVKDQITSILSQQKLTDEYQKWLSEIKANSKVDLLVNF